MRVKVWRTIIGVYDILLEERCKLIFPHMPSIPHSNEVWLQFEETEEKLLVTTGDKFAQRTKDVEPMMSTELTSMKSSLCGGKCVCVCVGGGGRAEAEGVLNN